MWSKVRHSRDAVNTIVPFLHRMKYTYEQYLPQAQAAIGACVEEYKAHQDGPDDVALDILHRWRDLLQDYFAKVGDAPTTIKNLINTILIPSAYGEVIVKSWGKHASNFEEYLEENTKAMSVVQEQITDLEERKPGGNPRKIREADYAAMNEKQIRSKVKADLASGLESFEFDSPYWPGAWHADREFTGGGMGKVNLWVRVDEHNTIVERIIRKDTALRKYAWSDACRWHGDLHDPNRVPNEYHIQNRLQQGPGSRSIFPALKCEVDWPRSMYRLYTPYAPHGDLASLIQSNAATWISELMLWRILDSLVEAGLHMENGNLDAPLSSRQQVVHRDIKPENVFLDAPDIASWPSLPTPKLADFGLAVLTSADDQFNPDMYLGSGTPGYLAPEQLSFVGSASGEPVDRFKLLAHTNVWGVGSIMNALMQRIAIPPLSYMGGELQHKTSDGANERYSAELCTLVNSCLAFDPARRPSFSDLRGMIARCVDSRSPANTRAGRYGRARERKYRGIGTGLPEDDEYRIGMVRQ